MEEPQSSKGQDVEGILQALCIPNLQRVLEEAQKLFYQYIEDTLIEQMVTTKFPTSVESEPNDARSTS